MDIGWRLCFGVSLDPPDEREQVGRESESNSDTEKLVFVVCVIRILYQLEQLRGWLCLLVAYGRQLASCRLIMWPFASH